MPDLEIKIRATGVRTLGEMREEVKKLKKGLNDLIPETKAFKDLSDLVAKKQTAVNNAMSMGYSDQAKLKDSYFKTGEELRRRTLPLMGGLANTIQMMPSGIRSVTSSLDMLVIQFLRLSTKTGGATLALRAMMSSMMGPAGIAIAVSLVTSLAFAFGEKLFGGVEKAKKEIESYLLKLADLRMEIDKLRRGELVAGGEEFSNLQAGVPALVKERAGILSKVPTSIRQREKALPLYVSEEELKRFYEITNQLADIELKGEQFALKRTEELKKQTDELEKQAELVRKAVLQASGPDTLPPTGLPRERGVRGLPIFGGGRGPLPGSAGVDVSAAIEGVARAKAKAAELSQTLKQGAQQFSQTLITGLMHGRDIASTIGMALLGVFTNVVTGGITSLLTGGAGGAVGGSLSAQKVIPKLAPTGQPQLVTRWKADEVAIFVQRGNAMLERNKK